MESVALLEMMGMTVTYVKAMPSEGCHVPSQNVVLIRAGLHPLDLEAVAAGLLTVVLAHLSTSLHQ